MKKSLPKNYGYVYVIKFKNGMVKVGRTQNPIKRMKQHESGYGQISDIVKQRVSCLHMNYQNSENSIIAMNGGKELSKCSDFNEISVFVDAIHQDNQELEKAIMEEGVRCDVECNRPVASIFDEAKHLPEIMIQAVNIASRNMALEVEAKKRTKSALDFFINESFRNKETPSSIYIEYQDIEDILFVTVENGSQYHYCICERRMYGAVYSTDNKYILDILEKYPGKYEKSLTFIGDDDVAIYTLHDLAPEWE